MDFYFVRRLVILSVLLVGSHGAPAQPSQLPRSAGVQNQVVLFLNGADRQSETDEQEKEILRALQDLRTLSPVALRERRYADYQLVPNQWTLAQLLSKYFLPSPLRAISDEDVFYRDAQDAKAREVIDEQIKAVREQRQALPK